MKNTSEKTLKAPQIDSYIHFLNDPHSLDYCTPDAPSIVLIDVLFKELEKIAVTGDDNKHELWLYADRGTIEAFGDFNELREYGEVKTHKEFEDWWQSEYPDVKVWYKLKTFQNNDGYRFISLGQRGILGIHPSTNLKFPKDVAPLVNWLISAVRDCIVKLKNNTYNDMIAKELPARHRTGTILRKEYWKIFPEVRQDYLSDVSNEDIREFLAVINQDEDRSKPNTRIAKMAANDFFYYCSLGYKANNHDNCRSSSLSPKELYLKYADGRDGGLCSIQADSSTAFHHWLHNGRDSGAHPWEIFRGGNSTHISLYAAEDEEGYYLVVDGESYGRSIETIKFFLALVRENLPVVLRCGKEMAARLEATDKIGIVPEGIFPWYCSSLFPKENILDFINLDGINAERIAEAAQWQPIKPLTLVKLQP